MFPAPNKTATSFYPKFSPDLTRIYLHRGFDNVPVFLKYYKIYVLILLIKTIFTKYILLLLGYLSLCSCSKREKIVSLQISGERQIRLKTSELATCKGKYWSLLCSRPRWSEGPTEHPDDLFPVVLGRAVASSLDRFPKGSFQKQ